MEKNKYDLVGWVADVLINHEHSTCRRCMFRHDKNRCDINNWNNIKYFNMPVCYYAKNTLIKELIKKYNL